MDFDSYTNYAIGTFAGVEQKGRRILGYIAARLYVEGREQPLGRRAGLERLLIPQLRT